MAIQVSGSTVISDARRVENLNNIRFQTATSNPTAQGVGQIYVNTSSNKAYVYTASGWLEIGNV